MKLELTKMQELVEGGDLSAIESYVKTAIEKSDMQSVYETNAEVKSFIDSAKDTHHAAALETWKSKNLQTLIDDAVKAAHPELTDEQKRIAELEKRVAQADAEKTQAQLLAELSPLATEAKIPAKVLELIVKTGGDDAKTLFEAVKEEHTTAIKTAVDAAFVANGRDPGGNGGASGKETNFAKELAKTSEDTQKAVDAQSHYFGN